jgi:hypothetical protein
MRIICMLQAERSTELLIRILSVARRAVADMILRRRRRRISCTAGLEEESSKRMVFRLIAGVTAPPGMVLGDQIVTWRA